MLLKQQPLIKYQPMSLLYGEYQLKNSGGECLLYCVWENLSMFVNVYFAKESAGLLSASCFSGQIYLT